MEKNKRFFSYIYSYVGDSKDRNVGFAKTEIRNSELNLSINLRGVYTDVPTQFQVYAMLATSGNRGEETQNNQANGEVGLAKLGTLVVNNGTGNYKDCINPENIGGTGLKFSDMNGYLLQSRNNFYTLAGLFDEEAVSKELIHFPENWIIEPPKPKNWRVELPKTEDTPEPKDMPKLKDTPEPKDMPKLGKSPTPEKVDQEDVDSENVEPELEAYDEENLESEWEADNNNLEMESSVNEEPALSMDIEMENRDYPDAERLFRHTDFINAFEDDDYYDCVEITPEALKKIVAHQDMVDNNSFLLHGYYNYRHLLFARVRENANGTKYFLGVPGTYCNRERFMASLFGFLNFKKSHRGDFENPYFGYWYLEL